MKTIDISDVVLKTARLKIRAFKEQDIHAFNEYFYDELFNKHVYMKYKTPAVAYTAFVQSQNSIEPFVYYFSLVLEDKDLLKTSHNVIGAIRLDVIDLKACYANLHLELHPSYWGDGLVTEASLAITQWAFEKGGFKKLLGTAHPDNIGSRKVLEKLGFVYSNTQANYLGPDQHRSIYFLENVG